jgi:hypothetical protein
MDSDNGERGFSAEGTVVEILERGGERFAKILIEQGTVLELPASSIDVSLGDRVLVDASLEIAEFRGRAKPGGSDAVAAAARSPAAPAERPTRRDYQHVLRIAGLFVLAIAGFLAWRSWMVADDFGVYGHYRAGAIADAAAITPVYAGQATCVVCHEEAQQVRASGRHAQIACEACHGPLGTHARGETDVAPIRPSSRGVCITCHASRLGLPKSFPRVVVNDHSEAGPCTECHKSHAPGIS